MDAVVATHNTKQEKLAKEYIEKNPDVPVTEVRSFLTKFRAYLRSSAGSLLSTIKSEQKLSPESEEALKTAIAGCKAM